MTTRRVLIILITASMSAVALVRAPASDAATLPVISIGSASVLEGNAGSRAALVPVSLSAASTTESSVNYATTSGSATSGTDFVAASGTLVFSPGSTTRYVTVTVYGDTTIEPREELTVTLSSQSGATLSRPIGTGVILNDDPSSGVNVGIGSAMVTEGNVGSRAMWFAVTLSARSTSTVSVRYATGSGTATAGSDFVGQARTLSFPAGTTASYVRVTVNGDATFEARERFNVTLSAPVGATIGRGTGIGTIVNDDAGTCGIAAPHPVQYSSVVVFAFENRTWSSVGGVGFGTAMPYLRSLGQRCPYFTDWTETDTAQFSLTQYVGQMTGERQPGTVDFCQPSATCSTTANNLFRQARRNGMKAINYVEGATTGCSHGGDARRNLTIPYMYMWGSDDRSYCTTHVRPLSEFNPYKPPRFAFITPTRCNNGHDCSNEVVDAWARSHVQPVLNSAAYRAGEVAVFIWYDEDRPVPNLWITPTGRAGARTMAGAGYAGTLKAWESMLGLPCLVNACTAPEMRTAANA